MATKAKFKVEDQVTFKGYAEDVPEEEQLLVEGETYTVAEVNDKEKSLAVSIDNPDFNAKKKESDSNPKTILVDVFFDEVDLADEDGEDEDEDEAAEEAPKAKAKTKAAAKPAPAKSKAKDEDEAEDEDGDGDGDDEDAAEEAPKAKTKAKAAPAKAAAKTKEKAAPAKGKAKADPKAKAKGKAKDEKEEEADAFPALETEDEEILALIDGADVLELAEELVEDSAALDYKLGGVLYHVRLSKAYQDLDPAYKENGGFGLYVKDKLNIEYRKAMYLIDIYYKFNLFGIDASKVQELGWTKCSKIAAVMTDDNAEELVELAEKSSVSELNDTIKESYKEVGGTKGEKRRKVAFKFRLWEDQASAVEETIKATAESMGFKDLSDAFEHIVMEWAAEHPIEKKAPAKSAKTEAKAPAKAKATAKARA